MGCCYGKRISELQAEFMMKNGNIQVICTLYQQTIKDDEFVPNMNKIIDEKIVPLAKRTTSIVITSEEIKTAPILTLEITESPTLERGQKYTINAAGYINSKRAARDGCTYIGTSDQNEVTREFPNDIVIPQEEVGMGETNLIIKYEPACKNYFIRDCGQGTGTFIKIEQSLILRQGYIISYGDSHMYINMLTEDKIQLKFLDGPKADHML